MRIGIDIRTLMDENYSGIPEYSLRIIHEILKLDQVNEYVLFYNSFKDVSARIPKFDYKNVKIINTNYPSKFFGYIMQKFLAWPKLDHLLKVDVFFMPHLNFAAFSDKAKTIVTVHDLSFMIYPEFFSLRKNIWHRSLNVGKSLKKIKHFITVSENSRQDLIDYCSVDEKKVSVIYPGISDDFKRITHKDLRIDEVKSRYKLPDKFILFLGTIEPRKNVDGLISAFEILMEENPDLSDYCLVIAGAKGWKFKKIFELWEKSFYKDKIIFTSYVDHEDKVYLYNLATIFIYPSFYEGFGFPPLEAMACGIPTIASANSSLSEILDDSVLFVNPNNINSLKLCMQELLLDADLQEKLRVSAYKTVEKYKWKIAAEKILHLFNAVKEKGDN